MHCKVLERKTSANVYPVERSNVKIWEHSCYAGLLLIILFKRDFIWGSLGFANIERLPNALAPNSILPWNQPTTFPSIISSVTIFVICSYNFFH